MGPPAKGATYDGRVTGDGLAYDIAVSFADAQRPVVEPIVRACQDLGLTVFYDRDSTAELWGRNFVYDLRTVYSGARARYFVPFLSEEYLASDYAMDEFNTATRRAIEIGRDGYILPITVGPVDVPAALLSPTIGRLRLEEHPVDELARIIAKRVGTTQERGQEPRGASSPAGHTPQVRLPRLPPADFSPYVALETALAQVGQHFQQAASQLSPYGVQCLVRISESALNVRVERQGTPVCGLRLRFDEASRDDRLLMAFAWPYVTGNSFNGWVTAEWDPDSRQSKLRYVDFASAGAEALITADELFELLWAKIIGHLDHGR